MSNTKVLAEQFIKSYYSTPELGNWDGVVELGRQLAESILSDKNDFSMSSAHAVPIVKTNKLSLKPNEDEIALAKNSYIESIKLYMKRTGADMYAAKQVLSKYRPIA